MQLLVAFLTLFLLAELASTQTLAPTVDLGYAQYQGFVNAETLNTEFLGIRYAAPPTGNFRWRAPRQPLQERHIQLANAHPNRCYQGNLGIAPNNPFTGKSGNGNRELDATAGNNTLQSSKPSESEDCLFLNVYSPGTDWSKTRKKKLPVVVWIHGGGYVLGSAGVGSMAPFDGPYDPSDMIELSKGNVVAVVIQYRLGLFGFLSGSHVQRNGALNAGLLDQDFALKWVQQHITKFGGDPSLVTIWGVSAGGGSVIQHMVANGGNTRPPLFRGGILSSLLLNPQPRFNHPIPEAVFARSVALIGCSARDKMACLRTTDVGVLQAANVQICKEAFSNTFAFGPVVDGTFIRESPSLSLARGKVNTKHILAVINGAEGVILVNPAVTPETLPLEQYVEALFPTLRPQDHVAVANHYRTFDSNLERFAEIYADSQLVCPTIAVLRSVSGTGYKGLFAVPPAWHADDIPYYFPKVYPPGPKFKNPTFIQAFAQAFVDFAVNQNPNVKEDPSSILPSWVPWNVSSSVEMVFNRSGEVPDIGSGTTPATLMQRCWFWASVTQFTGQ
ncbi:alpha/beta-hydrolase [Coprinopsis marcescibilis]|uniref:Carboxylic ester hydrolase n=1 Tax=Coprinopsis marcescibilis TaxID=230819 RepID=A0A5C3L4W3_COPMA|nr:alpha/beta-hydrolase [Coprinopsis marcescibilis]